MKLRAVMVVVLIGVLSWATMAPAAPDEKKSKAKKTFAASDAAKRANMEWWRDARFGMFIHWGVYSVPAGTYQGKKIPWIGEWIMLRGKIPVAEYRGFAKEFNPVKYDADAWVRLAKEAGMKYIVITSKHHDGFAMWDSKLTEWDAFQKGPKRDVVAELEEAIYGTRPWKTFGEGPAVIPEGHLADLKFKGFCAEDVRFTRSKDGRVLCVICLDMPGSRRIGGKSLGTDAGLLRKAPPRVTMLGSEAKILWTRDARSMTLTLPDQLPCEDVCVFRLAFE